MSLTYSIDEVTQAPAIQEERLREILKTEYGIIEGDLKSLTGYEDTNFLLTSVRWEHRNGPEKVIIKITNPIEAKLDDHMEYQTSLCAALLEEGLPCPSLVHLLDGTPWKTQIIDQEMCLPFRVFHLLPGSNLENFDFSPLVVRRIGQLMARLHTAADKLKLTTSHLPFISPDNFRCILRELDVLREMGLMTSPRESMVRNILEEYEERVSSKREQIDVGIIHTDFNETNLLVVDSEDGPQISGLLDFGDSHISARALDIGAACVYLHLSDRLNQGIPTLYTNLLEGYRSNREFKEEHLVLTCMKARLACSLVYGLRTARINYRGGSVDYVLRTQSNGWETLELLSSMKGLPTDDRI